MRSRKQNDINIHNKMLRRKAQWKKDRHQRRAAEFITFLNILSSNFLLLKFI